MKFIMVFMFIIFFNASHLLFSIEQQLIVIRHGEAGNIIEKVYNSNPEYTDYKFFDLTAAGISAVQMTTKKLLAQDFSNENISAVFVSPLPRTQQTADLLVQVGLVSKDKITVEKRLTELDAGDLEGKPILPEWNPIIAEEYHAESEEQLKKRVKEFYDSILSRYPQGNIVVVTHEIVSQNLIELVSRQNVKLSPGEAKVISLR